MYTDEDASIDELTARIRDLINEPRTKALLLKDKHSWNRITSSLDVIGDAVYALSAYKNDEGTGDIGSGVEYLALYGAFQALFLQQDAVRNICESLGVPWQEHQTLKKIRDLRNAATGHPTDLKPRKGETHSSHFINRNSLARGTLELFSFDETGPRGTISISVFDLMDGQEHELKDILRTMLNHMKVAEMEHRRKWREQKLEAALPANLDYWIEKIHTEIGPYGTLGTVAVRHIAESLSRLKDMLSKRDIEVSTYPGIAYLFPDIEYAVSTLAEFFTRQDLGSEPNIDPPIARMIAYFVGSRLKELRDMAREIDKDYENDAVGEP